MSCREEEEAAAEVKAKESRRRRASAALLKEKEGLQGSRGGREVLETHASRSTIEGRNQPADGGGERSSKQEICFRPLVLVEG